MSTNIEFEEWVKKAPNQLQADPLWQSAYYRLSMYLFDSMWVDTETLNRDFRGREIAKQLIRSVGGISANLEEAYGRGINTADHVRILRIALGETRESQGWYLRARQLLPADLLNERLNTLSQIIALLVTAITQQRKVPAK
jgi:four helix bundle protein